VKAAEEAAQRAGDEASAARQLAVETQAQYEAQQQALKKQQAEAAAENKELRDQVAALESEVQRLDVPALQLVAKRERAKQQTSSEFNRIAAVPAVMTYYTVIALFHHFLLLLPLFFLFLFTLHRCFFFSLPP